MKNLFSLGYYLHLTSGYAKMFASQSLHGAEVTPEQYGILYLLTVEDGLYQRQFSRFLVKDRPNISRMLDILEKKGYLYRKQDENCKRKVKVYITLQGKKLVEDLDEIKQEIVKEIASPLSKDEHEQLLNLLEKVRKNLEDKIKIQL